MRYSEMRQTIKSGDIIAFTHVGWKTWHDLKIQAVRFFTQSEYSHIAVAWVFGGRVFVIEAVIPLVRIFPLSKLGDFYHIPMDAPWNTTVEEAALSTVGQKYSQIQAIKAFFHPPKKDDLWQCCELAKEIHLQMGIDLGDKITPTGIVQSCLEMDKSLTFIQNP